MRNILLLGASRAGKTTFSRMLHEIYNSYQIVEGDAIREAYSYTINKDKSLTSDEVGKTDQYRNFIIKLFHYLVKYNKNLNYIFDTVDILPEHVPLFKENYLIIVFGYPNTDAKTVVDAQRKHDKENDWTYNLSEKDLLFYANYWIEQSKKLEQDCQKLNIKFVDVSIDREATLKQLLEWVINMNER